VPLNVHEFALDLTDKPVIQKDGSEVAMKNSSFKRDHSGKYFEYKYYLNLSQTDCRMSLEAFTANGKTRRMLLQYSISAFEVESAELQDEHRFIEQLFLGIGADTNVGKYLEVGPDAVGTRSMRIGNVKCLLSPQSPLNVGSSRTNEKGTRSTNGLALGSVTEKNLYQQSRKINFSTPAPLINAGPFIGENKESPHEGPVPLVNGVLCSQSGRLNIAMATEAMKVAMAARAGMQDDDQQRDISLSEDQTLPIQNRGTRSNSAPGVSGRLSSVVPSSDLQTPRKRVPDFDSPEAESETSDYQVCRSAQALVMIAHNTNIT
jgi:hypothetical protein